MKIDEQQERGYISKMETFSIDHELTKSWTSRLDPKTPISLLSIPGTHDSAAYSPHSLIQIALEKQRWSILQQLNSGIRFLDLRIMTNNEGKIMTHHLYAQYLDLKSTLKQIKTFLEQNPSQFIVAAFQVEQEYDPAAKVLDLLGILYIPYLAQKMVPNVGQLRGKVWILSGLGINFGQKFYRLEGVLKNEEVFLSENNNYFLQNQYRISSQFSKDDKWNAVQNAAFNIEAKPERMKFNFFSAAGLFYNVDNSQEGFWLKMKRRVVNVYNFVRYLPRNIFQSQRQTPNAKMLQELKRENRRNSKIGVCIMDFPGNQLIEAIIKTNDI